MKRFILSLIILSFALSLASQDYRFLRLTVDSSYNLDIVEMDWMESGIIYPGPAMTGWNTPPPLEVTGSNANWERFRLYDDTGADTRVGTLTSDPHVFREYILDLGSGNEILPDTLVIEKTRWGVLAQFRVELSMDMTQWDLFLDTAVSDYNWSTVSFPLQLIADTIPPSAPSNLAVEKASDNRIKLGWTPSTDNIGVEKYYVYQDSNLIDSCKYPFYSVGQLDHSTQYEFEVRAVDRAGNTSTPSNALITTTTSLDNTAPSLSGTVSVSNISATSAELSWPHATDNLAVSGYIIEVNGQMEGISEDTDFWLSGLRPTETYTVSVFAKDLAGNISSAISGSFTTSTTNGYMTIGTNFWNQEWSIQSNQLFTNGYLNVVGPQPWKPALLEEINYANTLRYMEMQQINRDAEYDWLNRKQKSNTNQDELAYGWMIDLCNRNESNLWLCIPKEVVHRNRIDSSHQHYLRKLAVLVKTGIDLRDANLDDVLWEDLNDMTAAEICLRGGTKVCDPLDEKLKIFIEYGNENWNNNFPQRAYCNAEGTAMGLGWDMWSAGNLFNAYASLTIFEEFSQVFGTDAQRVETVLPIQGTSLFWTYRSLTDIFDDPIYNPSGVYPNIISGHTYFGHGMDGDDPNIETLLNDDIAQSTEEIRTLYDSLDSWSAARSADIRLISYEGGHHVTVNYDSLNQNPIIYDVYLNWLDSISQYLEEVVVFSHVATNAFGHKNAVGQSIHEAHKYRALVHWLNQFPLPVDLISFEGKQTDDYIEITWTTANEMGLDNYEVQRSIDGINFDSLDSKSPIGDINQMNTYLSIDSMPKIGINYYRLLIKDLDNQMEYSPIIAIPFDVITKNEHLRTRLDIYPNPVNELLHIKVNSSDRNTPMQIIDQSGILAMSFETIPYYIPVSILPKGVFHIISSKYYASFVHR